MNWKYVVAVVAALLVVAGGAGAAVFYGAGPLGGAGESKVTDTPKSTGEVYTVDGGDGGNAAGGTSTRTATGTAAGTPSGTVTATPTEQLPPFYFTIKKVEKCGRTCRDVTATLTNNRDEPANGVSVYTRIFVGNSTKKGDKVWEGKRDVGRMKAQGSVTMTQRVKLSYSEALAVKNHDGWITILTTVSSEEVTITFKSRRDVT